ncbi:hypothetical protein AU509_14890 [Lonsdalea britannica]|uniref:MoaF-like domain-containing protein n=1 Tax=Lonsdalea britannica TaxID=1082704 RepID=A0AAD0SHD4_9GAMM|nr:hypothetical protein [Lonsdalea britannica]AXW87927.1 hypothetical protein CKQ53_13740 [Lonsdalea britannica]OSM94757.1 hypothetical protein AU509_14890 [Lonsdalea britannica]OSN02985.1 hypothetical protein AU510_16125 [Lonsdalea britannica]
MSTKEIFPYAGSSFVITFNPQLVIKNTYSTEGDKVTAEFMTGDMAGTIMTIPFQWESLPDDYFLIAWQEEDKSTVVHCDNFVKKTSRAFYTMMDGSFYVMKGEIC